MQREWQLQEAKHNRVCDPAALQAWAQRHGLTIATRNLQDFTAYPQVFSPWAL